jgi:hypothetical protein
MMFTAETQRTQRGVSFPWPGDSGQGKTRGPSGQGLMSLWWGRGDSHSSAGDKAKGLKCAFSSLGGLSPAREENVSSADSAPQAKPRQRGASGWLSAEESSVARLVCCEQYPTNPAAPRFAKGGQKLQSSEQTELDLWIAQFEGGFGPVERGESVSMDELFHRRVGDAV